MVKYPKNKHFRNVEILVRNNSFSGTGISPISIAEVVAEAFESDVESSDYSKKKLQLRQNMFKNVLEPRSGEKSFLTPPGAPRKFENLFSQMG